MKDIFKNPLSKHPIVVSIFAVVFLGGGGFLIKYYFFNESRTPNVQQNSYGSGDNVAGDKIINSYEGVAERHLDKAGISELSKFLPTNKDVEIQVWYLMGNTEAKQYASEIKMYLESQKWNVDPILGSFNWFEPVVGVQVKNLEGERKWRFEVGSVQ